MKKIDLKRWLVNVKFLGGVIVFLFLIICVVYGVKEKEKKIRVNMEQELTQTLRDKKEAENNWQAVLQEKEVLQQELKGVQEKTVSLAERLAEQEKQMTQTLDDLEKETAIRQSAEGQLIVVLQEKRALQARVKDLMGSAAAVELEKVVVKAAPPITGKILAVDRQQDFIVVNLGREDNLKLGDSLSVYHDGKIIGKVEVERITTNVSAATILPEWKGVEFNIDDEVQGI